MKPSFSFLMLGLSLIFGCTHRAENVEITYKSPKRAGYQKSTNQVDTPKKVSINEDEDVYELKSLENSNIKAKPQTHQEYKPKIEEYHIVGQGETYYSIARLYNLSPKDLMKYNNYKESEPLYINQKIKLKPSSYNEAGEALYIKKNQENKPISDALYIKKTEPAQNSPSAMDGTNQRCKDKFSLPIKEKKILIDFNQIQSGGVISDGITFVVNGEEKIKASKDGEVVYVGNQVSDYGNVIILKHEDNYFSIYGYLKSTNIKEGSNVKKGDVISYTSIKDKKFYFAVRKGKTPVKPIFCI